VMRAVINGKVYDTSTAKEIHKIKRYPKDSWHHYSETLYRTRRGNWFLYGEGLPASKYATRSETGDYTSGERIDVFSASQAFHFLESHGDVESLKLYFNQEVEEA